ncbi:HAD family hydrolase [Eggerthellaceae bacterium 3-80]|nr:HAD family hydrolase [bacterium D16-34]
MSQTDTRSQEAKNDALTHPQFNTFIFDLDGTLLDTLPDLVVLTNTSLEAFGLPPRTTDEIHSFVGNGAKALIYQAVPEDTDPQITEQVMQRWKDLYSTVGNQLTKPYPHIVEMVKELKSRGVGVGVLSNKFDAGVQAAVDEYLPGLFEVRHGESDEIPRKPDPTGLLRSIDELTSDPQHTVYIGDSPGDIRTARNAGTYAIGVGWGYHSADELREAGADAVVMDALELLAWAPDARE